MTVKRMTLAAAAAALPFFCALWASAAPGQKRALSPRVLTYNRDIRPILAENCFACHGPDSAARKADLRIDRFADATADRNGRAPIVPGRPDRSELVRRILGQGPVMPPPSSHKKLTREQIQTLIQWIRQGARYELHWSYLPPRRPAIPTGEGRRTAAGERGAQASRLWKTWPRNPIDHFILARLEKEGLAPAPEADRRTLARRLSLDLVGLPPDPADVEAFVKDRSPNYYEKYVDKLLASPHWGEHRGRYWLDAARYADTHGIHFDNYREMWSYRDWVIRAFNQNMPFDQFTIEQLAGDLLPGATLDQQIASGFNRCNITTNEGGAIDEEYRVLYARDRTETASFVWLGTTMNCATCHDHKFDPFTMKDFYSLSAFFNNTTQPAMDGNIKDTPPVVFVPLEEDRPRMNALKEEIARAVKLADARKAAARADFDGWLSRSAESSPVEVPEERLLLRAPLTEGQGREVQVLLDGRPVRLSATAEPGWEAGHVGAKAFQRKGGSAVEIPAAGDFEKDQAFTCAAWVRIPRGDQGGSIVARMDEANGHRGWDLWLEGGRVGAHIINTWPSDALKVVAREPLKANQWHHVAFTYGGGANQESLRIYVDGELKPADAQANALKSSIRAAVPLKIGQRHSSAGVDGVAIQDVRLYGRALTQQEVQQLATGTRAAYLISRGAGGLAAGEKDELFGWWLTGQDQEYRSVADRLAALRSEEQAIRARGAVAHVMQERGEEAMAYILFRGEYDKRRDKVTPATPAVLPPMPPDLPRNRLGLARWLVSPGHPLTARVTVNRFWQEVFGTGLVRTTGDFGVSGELPTHPELLDWLALEFANPTYGTERRPWDVKRFFKLMVTSATYRQAAVITPEKKRKDPANRLLSRGPRFRMDAEMVRDYALAASGLLVRKLGGPSVKPYQPPGVWEAVAMIGSNTRDYKQDTGENLYRRSLYTFWKRSAPPASMEIFNAPNRETCVVRRERTNTPLQALVTLNDVQFVEAARHLAQRALLEGGSATASRMDFMARRLLARPLRPAEQAVAQRSLAGLEKFYRSHEKEARELIATGESEPDPSLDARLLAAWTMLANQLMNLDEVLNK